MTLSGTVCPACYTPSWDMAAPFVELTTMDSVAELTFIMERTSIVELTAIVETWLSASWNSHGHLNRDTLANGVSGML